MTRPSVIPPAILEMTKFLERVPSPAETLRLFMMPSRIAMARKEAEILAGFETFELENRGDKIQAWSMGEGPLVILTHGWSGRSSQLAGFAAGIVERGRRVVMFDAPAHGDSEGTESTGLRVAETLHDLQSRLGNISAIVAHSFGVVGSNVALWQGLLVQRVAYIAGLVHIPQRFIEFAYACGLNDAQVQEYWDLAEAEFGVGILEQISGDVIAPRMSAGALVIHDVDDNEVGIEQAVALAEAWPGAELIRTEGLGHRRIIRSPEVIRLACDFVCA